MNINVSRLPKKIIRLLESEVKVSPLVIDGNWGAGKTEFCQKLIHLIEDGETNLRPIYVDAFKADHADEPLMTLMAAVLKALPEAEREPLTKKSIASHKVWRQDRPEGWNELAAETGCGRCGRCGRRV